MRQYKCVDKMGASLPQENGNQAWGHHNTSLYLLTYRIFATDSTCLRESRSYISTCYPLLPG